MVSRKKAVLLCVICAALAACAAFFAAQRVGETGRLNELTEISRLVRDTSFYGADLNSLFDGAAKGIMRSLGDDYAAYYTEDEYNLIQQRYAGQYTGIGISLINRDGLMYVGDVYEGTPAEKAGVHPGDLLVQLNGKAVVGLQPEEVSALIPEDVGASVQLVVNRGGANEMVEVKVAELVRHRVRYRLIDDVAYIAIDEFSGDCVEGFRQALMRAADDGAKSLVLDLRGNPGGNLESVVQIADMLLGEGVILTVCTRDGRAEAYVSDAEKVADLPMAVLINGSSASASEVLAGALRDHQACVLVGETTYGKGIVQTTYSLNSSGGRVKLTTAAYYTPSGENIHKKGIEPDVKCGLPSDLRAIPVRRIKLLEDTQLQVALEEARKRAGTAE